MIKEHQVKRTTSRSKFNLRGFIFLLILGAYLLFSSITPLSATSQLSIPLGHRVYDVLESAEIRGLIPKLPAVKPYTTSTVLQLLGQLQELPLPEKEHAEVVYLIDRLAGEKYTTSSCGDLLSSGSYHTFAENQNIYLAAGAKSEVQATISIYSPDEGDYRFAIRPYIRSDIKNMLSFYMDVGLRFDKLDSRPFLDSDFYIPGEGFYMNFLTGKSAKDSIPFPLFFAGFDLYPEISLALLEGMFEMRWGSVKRDWGVGTNGLQLAGKAAPFEAIEGHVRLADWLRYSFLTGSLGGFALKNGIIGNDSFFAQDLHDNQFNNNFSAKRVEVDLPWNITFGIYESCVWIKRFEIGYLNPFTILMLQQSLLGDMDNMLAGIDLQWRWPGLFRLYVGAATTEMNQISPSEFFTNYRNIMGIQGGIDIDLPIGQFSKISFQYTKLEPFFYTHYPLSTDTEGEFIHISYVNKGFSLGYPLHPNSDELLVSTRIGVSNTLNTFLTLQYQRRSAQYGYAIDMSVNEYYKNMGSIAPKDFLGHLFEKNLSIEIGLSKEFEAFPITMYGSYRFGSSIERGLDTATAFNHIPNTPWSSPAFDHVVQIGCMIYH